MISPILLLVLLAVMLPLPAFAIPVGDLLGPILAWFATMVGFASAGLALLASWTTRRLRITSPVHAFLLITVAIAILSVFVVGFTVVSWSRYTKLQHDVAISLQKDAERAEEMIHSATSTEQVVPTFPIIETPNSFGSNDLISARVTSSTKLVPTEILKQVVAESHWSDRIQVLDIREPEEREIGYIPATSTNIRYGDLLYDLQDILSPDKDILVICWTSKRGEEITTLLRKNGFPRAFAIKGGLQGEPIQGIKNGDPGWIDSHLPWKGDDRWSDRFTNFTYINLAEAKKRFDQHATIVDTRDKEDFDALHLPGSINIPIKYMTTTEINSSIAQLDRTTHTLLVTCAEYVDCFYGRILGVRLSRLGWTFDEPFRDLSDWKQAGYPISSR